MRFSVDRVVSLPISHIIFYGNDDIRYNNIPTYEAYI